MSEVWAPVPGYERTYEVSTLGQFRRRDTVKCLAFTVSKTNGYVYVRLSQDGKALSKRAHKLVLEAHKGPSQGQQTRHLNGVRHDNRIDNLEWGTALDNWQDQERHGTANGHYRGKFGEANPQAKLKISDMPAIKIRLAAGEKQKDIAKDYGVHQSTISNLVRNVTRY